MKNTIIVSIITMLLGALAGRVMSTKEIDELTVKMSTISNTLARIDERTLHMEEWGVEIDRLEKRADELTIQMAVIESHCEKE
jgi:hypothetical protein